MTFKTLIDAGHDDIIIASFQDGSLNLERGGDIIELSPRMVRQLADFIERELGKDSTQ